MYQDILDGPTTLKVDFYTISSADVLACFCQSFHIGYYNKWLVVVTAPLIGLLLFLLEVCSVPGPYRIFASSEGCEEMVFFFIQWLFWCTYSFSPVSEGVDDTVFCSQVVIAVPMQIHVCMGWFSIDSCQNWTICLWCYQTIQEGDWPICLGFFLCELNLGVNVVDMMEKLVLVCRLQDDTSVVHKPFPHLWRVLGCLNGSYFKFLHEKVGHYWADRWPHGCSINLFLEVALELEISCFETELQKACDVIYLHFGS